MMAAAGEDPYVNVADRAILTAKSGLQNLFKPFQNFRLPTGIQSPLNSSPKSTAKRDLLELCEAANYGVNKFDAADKERFEEYVAELEAASPIAEPVSSPSFSGVWRLLWTTETELLFAVEKGLLASGPCTGVEQVIDMAAGTLSNTILFENDSRLVVGSTISPDPEDATGKRFKFAFDQCSLVWRGFSVPLPPIGKGWGDLTYLDDDLRIQRDIRGDILIATKSPLKA